MTFDPQKLWQGARRQIPPSKVSSALLLLHGVGSDANDLIELAPYLQEKLPHTAFISPNAPFAFDMAPFGRQWFSLQSREPDFIMSGVQKAYPAVCQMINDIKEEFGLSSKNIALFGFSQGAMMSLYTTPRLEDNVAAVVSMSGAVFDPAHLQSETRSRPPILLCHGEKDPIVPFAMMEQAKATLLANGFSVETVSRPLMEHSIDEVCLSAAGSFLQKHLISNE